MTTRIEEIYETVLPEMEANGFEDTPVNRYWMLAGLRDAWNEDPETSFEKSLYVFAITMELMLLRMNLSPDDLDPDK